MYYPDKECAYCNNVFTPKTSNNIYCSIDCSIQANREKSRRNSKTNTRLGEILECKQCGKKFKRKSSSHKFCSTDCCNTYYIEISEYSIKRIYIRDGFRCSYCGKTAYSDYVELHADHIIPKSDGGKDIFGNLITTCKRCNLSKGKKQLEDSVIVELQKELNIRNKAFGVSDNTKIRFRTTYQKR